MTTDTVKKEIAVSFEIGGKTCTIGAIAKGSGMIHPNMATMLAFITTDAAISSDMLRTALTRDIKDSFNQLSVDGDTSTNDMAMILANGMAGNAMIDSENHDFSVFCEALHEVTAYITKCLAADGEGASKLITCNVSGAPDKDTARKVAKSVVSSNLLKAAIFGEDANWGRVQCAIGYTDADFSADDIDLDMSSEFGRIPVCRASAYADHSEDQAAKILKADEVVLDIDLHDGNEGSTAWGCDLTYDYVKINGDYRS
jgi:glutamate N-acetyltransferase/amino-acid N-acetyltransferase